MTTDHTDICDTLRSTVFMEIIRERIESIDIGDK